MPEPKKRRLLDHFGASPTYVAEGCHVRGDLETPGAFVLSGTLEGDARIGGAVSVGKGASWLGSLEARAGVIAGEIRGNVTIREKLEIGASAVIRGNIAARSLAIANGAVIEGEIAVTGDEPLVRFEEKRASRES